MAGRLQFSLRTLFWLFLAIALVVWPTASLLRSYLATRGFVRVTGTVTFKGQPRANATVMLVPRRSGAKSVQGTTDQTGRFTCETLVEPGEYDVAVTSVTSGLQDLPLQYAGVATSGITVYVVQRGGNDFRLDLSD